MKKLFTILLLSLSLLSCTNDEIVNPQPTDEDLSINSFMVYSQDNVITEINNQKYGYKDYKLYCRKNYTINNDPANNNEILLFTKDARGTNFFIDAPFGLHTNYSVGRIHFYQNYTGYELYSDTTRRVNITEDTPTYISGAFRFTLNNKIISGSFYRVPKID